MTDDKNNELNLESEEDIEEKFEIHPLERSWTLWYDCPVKKYNNTNYELNKVHNFNTVEDFWGYY
jgi:hypothetical protein